MLVLRVLSGRRLGHCVKLLPPGGIVGSGTKHVLYLPEPSVAEKHGQFHWADEGWYIQALDENHQILLDSRPVSTVPTVLCQNGLMQVGQVLIDYWQEAVPASIPSTLSFDDHLRVIAERLEALRATYLAIADDRARLCGPPAGLGAPVAVARPMDQLATTGIVLDQKALLLLLATMGERLEEVRAALNLNDASEAQEYLRAATFILGDVLAAVRGAPNLASYQNPSASS